MNIRVLLISASLLAGLLFSGCSTGVGKKDVIRTDDGELLTVEEMWEGMRK